MISPQLVAWGENGSIIREIAEYGARRALEAGAENVFNFTIGSPSVDPPPCVHETMKRLLDTAPPTELHAYAPAPGMPEVRRKLADYLTEAFGVPYRAQDVLLTDGASTALALVTRVLLSEGGRCATLTPYFSDYAFYVEAAGGAFTAIPSEPGTFQMDLAAVERALTPDTRMLILNSPNNPSGVVLSRAGLEALAALLEAKQAEYGHPVYIVADEPYRELVYDGIEVPFLPAIYRNTIYCYSFSKSLSLPGERIGFLALPEALDGYAAIHSALLGVMRAYGYICLPPLLQLTAAACVGQTSDVSVYRGNRDLLYGALCDMGYACVHPDGAFYLFVRAPEGDAEAFCRRAMAEDLLLVPGTGFGCPDYARIAYCVPRGQIERALPVFRRLAEAYGLAE